MIPLHTEALDYIESKFNILLKLDVISFDHDWDLLIKNLKKIKVDVFQPNDRILICHMDTDYYDPLLPTGVVTTNLVRCFNMLDIPLYLLLFVTNNYGIGAEFDLLLKNHHKMDRPTIIETLLTSSLGLVEVDDATVNAAVDGTAPLNVEKIEKQGLCMVGRQRSHRVALINFFKNKNLLDKVALSVNFSK